LLHAAQDKFVGHRSPDGAVRLGVDLPDLALVVKKGAQVRADA
jgi:hypothetical protein